MTVRLKRQQLLQRDPPLQYSAILDESVLRRRIGGPAVMHEQLAHLAEVAKLPNVTLQVHRLGDKYPIVINPFDLLRFGAVGDATIPDSARTVANILTLSNFTGTNSVREARPMAPKQVRADPLANSPRRLQWQKSSYSNYNGNCVEVAGLPGGERAVRDSKDAAGPALRFAQNEWASFVAAIKLGEFDA